MLGIATVVLVVSAVLLTRVTFDSNPIHLRDPHTEGVTTLLELADAGDAPLLNLVAVAPSDGVAQDWAARLRKMPEVRNVVTIDELVPRDQDEKLALLGDLRLLLGPKFATLNAVPPDPAALDESLAKLEAAAAGSASAAQLEAAAAALRKRLAAAAPDARDKELRALDGALTSGLPAELGRLSAGLHATKFDRAALPENLADRWLASGGRELVEITPTENVSDNATASRFISAVRSVAANATGLPVVYQEASATVVEAFERALLYAFVMVGVIIYLSLHGWKDTLFVVVPIVLATAVTAALAVLIDMPFNYANIIALPLLVGIGVDNGIHVVHRLRTERANAAVRHEHDARRARERADDDRELRQPGVLVARRHREHGYPAGAGIGREHGLHADRVARVAEGVRRRGAAYRMSGPKLVTGANGFLGAAVVRALLADGERVRAFVRAGSDRRNLLGLDVEIAEGDVTDRASLDAAVRGCAGVYHVAADYRLWVADPAPMYRTNVEGSVNVLDAAAAAGVPRVVYTSSVAVLGINEDRTPADEETPVTAGEMIGHYKRSKFLAEQAVRARARELELAVVTVNPSTPIGPGDVKPTPTGRILLDAAAGRMPAFVDTGLNLVHVDDVALAAICSRSLRAAGERYILGGRDFTSAAKSCETVGAQRSAGDPRRFAFRTGSCIRSRLRQRVGRWSRSASRA